MQRFSANITFQIPPDHVLISKVEFDNLKQQELAGKYWGMVELEQRINKKHE